MNDGIYDTIAVTIRAALMDDRELRLDLADAGTKTELIADHALCAALACGATVADVYEVLWERFPDALSAAGGSENVTQIRWAIEEAERRGNGILVSQLRSFVLGAMRVVVSGIEARASEPVLREAMERMNGDDVALGEVMDDGEYRRLYESALFDAFAAEAR